MARSSRFGQLLAGLLLLAASPASALPAEAHPPPAQREVAQPAPSPWVTVDASGKAATITPTVTTSNGVASTISPAPDALLKTGTYTLSPTSGAVKTTTGLSPVATASSPKGDGVFFACQVYVSVDRPFCQPQSGSRLNPGKTYYITWSDVYFGDNATNRAVTLQASYNDGTTDKTAFTSPRMLASTGFYAWTVPDTFLSGHTPSPLSSVNLTLSLASYEDAYSLDVDDDIPGPTVIVSAASSSSADDPSSEGGSSTGGGRGGGGGHKTNAAAIAVPIVVILVVLGLAGFCFRSWRKHGSVPLVSAMKRRSTGGGQGYGVRQSRSERVGAATAGGGGAGVAGVDKEVGGGGVELTDRDSWSPAPGSSPPGGRNVFREEMDRQQRTR